MGKLIYKATDYPKVSHIYNDVRKKITEKYIEWLSAEFGADSVKRISNTEIAVVVGQYFEEDDVDCKFPIDVCAVCKAQTKSFYDKSTNEKGEALSREVVMFDIDAAAKNFEIEKKSKGVPKK